MRIQDRKLLREKIFTNHVWSLANGYRGVLLLPTNNVEEAQFQLQLNNVSIYLRARFESFVNRTRATRANR